jgi:probable HAF family extracellular repeat protein
MTGIVTHRHRRVVAATAVMAAVAVLASTPATAAIVATDLGTLAGDTFSEAASVRADGLAVGHSMRSSGARQAVVFAPSRVTPLATLGGNSAAHDVNRDGVVVGEAESTGVGRTSPVWWDVGGAVTVLPGGHHGSARGVNDAGVVVGVVDDQGAWAVRWERPDAPVVRLATLPGGAADSAAYAVNAAGVAVGYSRGVDGVRHAVRWDAAGVRGLDAPPGRPSCFATDLNDAGTVVGSCGAGDSRVAVRWDGAGAVTVLSTLGGSFSDAAGINDAGVVVGYAEDGAGQGCAVRWSAFGLVTRLATLGGLYGVVLDVNDAGTVVGRATTTAGQFHATRWRDAG